jgi:hypothetical protein
LSIIRGIWTKKSTFLFKNLNVNKKHTLIIFFKTKFFKIFTLKNIFLSDFASLNNGNYIKIPFQFKKNNMEIVIDYEENEEVYSKLFILQTLYNAFRYIKKKTATDYINKHIRILSGSIPGKIFRSFSIPLINLIYVDDDDTLDEHIITHEFCHQIFYSLTSIKLSTVLGEFFLGDLNFGNHYLSRLSNKFNALFEGYPEGLARIILNINSEINIPQLHNKLNSGLISEGAISNLMVDLHNSFKSGFFDIFMKPLIKLRRLLPDKNIELNTGNYLKMVIKNNIQNIEKIRKFYKKWNILI